MASRHATGRLRWPSAMQLNSHRHRRGREDKTCPYLLADPLQPGPAAGRATHDSRAGARCSCPSLWSQWREVRLNSALRVIELYQGLVRAFQRCRKDYELRWGQPYARTIAAFANRRYAYGAGEIGHLVTHVWRRSS